jgi:hypothetical protein
MFATTTSSPLLDAELAYHRERVATDFRSAALLHDARRRRRARKVAAARRHALRSATADVR